MDLVIFSVIEAVYLVYMFNYFKTTYSVHHPFEILITGISKYLEHPIGTGHYENKICKFGHDISWYLAFYLIIRNFLDELTDVKKETICLINKFITYCAIGMALLTNMNAFIYLIPILVFEFGYFTPKFC